MDTSRNGRTRYRKREKRRRTRTPGTVKTINKIMCLYPRFMRNKRWIGKENLCKDYRHLWVPVGCGECYECRKQKAQQWRVRLLEELKQNKYAYFITLTFSDQALEKLVQKNEQDEVNEICTKAVRLFLERYRKIHGCSLRHWLITELGHEGTERIHLHGILWRDSPITNSDLQNWWKYGITDTGEYCNARTINYIIKYVTKIDKDHKTFKAKILSSPGLGNNFTKTLAAQNTYRYIPGESKEHYTLPNGRRVGLPMYYKNKLYTEEERQQIWTDRLNKGIIWCNGIKIRNANTIEGYHEYLKVLKDQQAWNTEIGFGSTEDAWKKENYKVKFKKINGL